MNLQDLLLSTKRNAIELCFGEGTPLTTSKFGGRPLLPPGFTWPRFFTDTYEDDEKKDRPLSFLVQIDCAEAAPLDREELLPKTGVLSFFYELGSQRWGYDPADAGCARAFYFPQKESLVLTDFPKDLEKDYRLPEISFSLQSRQDFPDWTELSDRPGFNGGFSGAWEEYEGLRKKLGAPIPQRCSKLLGYADVIQNNMLTECELIRQGHYLGQGWPKMNQEQQTSLLRDAAQWTLLFQLDIVEKDDFELMFGDCGRIYFYIRKSDLQARRFDRVWLILQCS